MFIALGSASIASFSTNTTQLSVKIRVASHESGANITGISTVATSFDALSHHLYHVAIKAGSRTDFTLT